MMASFYCWEAETALRLFACDDPSSCFTAISWNGGKFYPPRQPRTNGWFPVSRVSEPWSVHVHRFFIYQCFKNVPMFPLSTAFLIRLNSWLWIHIQNECFTKKSSFYSCLLLSSSLQILFSWAGLFRVGCGRPVVLCRLWCCGLERGPEGASKPPYVR